MRIVMLLIAWTFCLLASPLTLTFEGNKKISDSSLYDALGLRKPYPIEVWEDLPSIESAAVSQSLSGLTSFYRSKGFYHAKITSETKDNAVVFKIEENDPILVGDVKINSPIDVDSAVSLQNNDVFDQEKFSASKAEIKKRYAQAGYCNAQFNSKAWVDIETNHAYLLFEATPGEPCTFGAVNVESTPNINGKLTASMLRFKEGDPYNVEAIRQSYEALYAQEGVTRVIINDNERNGSVVPIMLNIEEAELPIRFTAGLGYSSDEGITAQTGIKHRNFLGDLKTLSLDARYSPLKQEASGTFGLPLENRGLLGAEIGYKNEIFDGYKTASTYEKLTAKYQDKPASAMMGILFDEVKTYQSKDITTFPNSKLFIASPIGELNYDTRDKPLNPTKGYWLNANVMGSLYTPGLSDATYFKSLLSGAYITSIDEQVFGAKLKWGTLRVYDGSVPSSYRFYAGGMNSNRAYMYRDLGPKNSDGDPIGFASITEGTVEYRFPIYQEFRGVLFSDVTFASQNIIPDYAKDGYLGIGFGFRYVTPVGPVAIDFGFNPEDFAQNAIHFRIGELF
ncbi:MAG: BamA/TamA family outer membrane protein [Sulfuricurvum sp.]|uniref:autotransporter assembly complex protein TamA n=1 Tax=Sulfuricurvum sp. TaxID=2025608 RepID=UPI0026271BF0|nr:outer membrane protein assembly factor [Sulfuricurvum sp.]MDD2369347.1 BamA/TamA family outer membrane protein [Sulfuricurvum sp.]MDD2951287.1 BamA/TamA family outer membrane protein [Sulfuricurvum sp.]MDD5119365.1 BamA/TamA family outer membrane protein [Sulfuricurvum sp.]